MHFRNYKRLGETFAAVVRPSTSRKRGIQWVRFWAAWRSNPVLFGQYACTRRALSQPYELNLPDRFRRWIVFSSNLRGCSSPTP